MPIDPKLFKKFLIAEENKYIAFSNKTNPEDLNPIIEMLEKLHFKKENIIKLFLCSSCLDKGNFKIIDKGYQIKSFKNQIICPKCALDIVLRQAESRNLFSANKIKPKLPIKWFLPCLLECINIRFNDTISIVSPDNELFVFRHLADLTERQIQHKFSEGMIVFRLNLQDIPAVRFAEQLRIDTTAIFTFR